MKKLLRIIIGFLLISSIILPIIPVKANLKTAQDEEIHLRLGQGTFGLDWDPTIYHESPASTYRQACLENLVLTPPAWDGDLNKLIPMLATDWEIEYWVSEMNSLGFLNSGGIKSINFTLRENVTFHDGSLWNASAAKWNFDRVFIITGNLTGNGDTEFREDYWTNAQNVEPFFTPSWNLSWAIGNYGSYNGLQWTDDSMLNLYPNINKTTVLDDGGPDGGGIIKIDFNDWNPFGWQELFDYSPTTGGGFFLMISMDAYKDDYTDKPFYGYGSGSLIGTGPYKFDHHTETGPITGGLLRKNEDYWNRTYWEDQGWFEVTHIDTVLFADDETGVDARNIALETGGIDVCFDIPSWRIDYDSVIANPDLIYEESQYVAEAVTAIVLSCINETYWKEAWDLGIPDVPFTDGIPRLLRKAISYAFDYDSYIQNAENGRAKRAISFLHMNNTYTNESIPMPYKNLTIARAAMLEQYPTECAARSLDINSPDSAWQTIAVSNPIHRLNFYWDISADYQVLKNVLVTSLANIGCNIYDDSAHELSPHIWAHIVGGTFEYFTAQAWPLYWDVKLDDLTQPYVWYYFYNPGDWTFEVSFNLAFSYLDNVSLWLDAIYYSNKTLRPKFYNDIAITLQTYQYPWVWISQPIIGTVYSKEWEMDLDQLNGLGNFLFIRYVGKEKEFPFISGYFSEVVFSISTIAIISVIYVMMRKKKLTKKY